MRIFGQTAYKIRYKNLYISVRYMKSSVSESKAFQSRNSRPSWAKRTAELFQIETGVLN